MRKHSIWPLIIKLIKELKMTKIRICSIPDCGNKISAKGLCNKHYKSLLTHGDPNYQSRTPNNSGKIFVERAVETNDKVSCIIYPFRKNRSGYGRFESDGVNWRANRYALTLFSGPPEDGMCACHKPIICKSPSCVNPHHLYWGTHLQNMQDIKINGTKIVRARGEKSGRSKLNKPAVIHIRESGMPTKDLARIYNVDRSSIRNVLIGKTWSHIP